MNRVVIMGRLVREPDVKTTANDLKIAKYTLAVDRKTKEGGADYIPCTAYGKSADFVEKYLHKGTKMLVSGHIQTGNYTNKDGQKVYTTEVVIDEQEFAESKKSSSQTENDDFPNFD